VSSETSVDLRVYIDRVLEERDRASSAAVRAMEHRLDGLNQLRQEVTKDRDQFLQKAVYDQMHSGLQDRVSKMENWQSKMLGFGGALIVLSGSFGAIIGYVLTRR